MKKGKNEHQSNMEQQEEVKILDLPRFIVEKIAKYVPKENRLDLCLTSSDFNDIVCRAEKFQKRLKITDANVSRK